MLFVFAESLLSFNLQNFEHNYCLLNSGLWPGWCSD